MSWSLGRVRSHLRSGILLALIALAEYGSPWPVAGRAVTFALAAVLTIRFVRQSLRHLRLAAQVAPVIRTRIFELALTAVALALLASKGAVWLGELLHPGRTDSVDVAYRQYAAAFLVVAGLRIVVGDFSIRRLFYRLELKPAQTVALTFAAAILAGTLLLSLPLSVRQIEEISLVDALFTATSAVTVTGLLAYDPGTYHTALGQGVILLLIQLGGLGTMVASASLVIMAGRKLHLRRARMLQEALDLETVGHVRSQVKTLLGFTLLSEALGASALYVLWRGRGEIEAPLFAAVFHAVSAFCNAGFSTFASGLLDFRDDVATSTVVMLLVVTGGLGLPVLHGAARAAAAARSGRRAPGLSLHTRLALLTTGVLLAGGAVGVCLLEWRGMLAPLHWMSRVSVAAFLSVTSRTAGFSTVPIAELAPASLWLIMLLMFIGGSPGSTAGGIKTTTAATVAAALWATLGGRPRVEAFRRTIADEQVAKALALVGVALATVAGAILILLATQRGDALALTFEAVSAFGTVGLSTGITSALDTWGKVILMVLMFVGRTGPLTLGFALATRAAPARITYPTEKIMIG